MKKTILLGSVGAASVATFVGGVAIITGLVGLYQLAGMFGLFSISSYFVGSAYPGSSTEVISHEGNVQTRKVI